MARASAILALLIAAIIAMFAALQASWGFVQWELLVIVAMFVAPAALTLLKRDMGLRLLIAAWGIFLGISCHMLLTPTPPHNPNLYSIDPLSSAIIAAFPVVAALGLLLALFHKQR
jgi:hypothetical protein